VEEEAVPPERLNLTAKACAVELCSCCHVVSDIELEMKAPRYSSLSMDDTHGNCEEVHLFRLVFASAYCITCGAPRSPEVKPSSKDWK